MKRQQYSRFLSVVGFLSLSLVLFSVNNVHGQISIGYFSSTGASVDNYAEAIGTKTTTNNITLQYNVGSNYVAGWKVRIKANGNFTNGASVLPSQYVSLQYNGGGSGVSGGQVPLTSTEVDLVNSTQNLGGYTAHNFNSIITGGPHMLNLLSGTYRTTITVSFYNNAGLLIATRNNIEVSFNMNFNNTCSGASVEVSTSTVYNFDTYAKTQVGATVPEAVAVQFRTNGAKCTGWSLKVRANGNFLNGQSSIPSQYISLRFNRVSQGLPSAAAIGISNTPVALGVTDANLINNSNAGFDDYFTVHTFDIVIQGGVHLQVGATGIYTCPLTFSLYNQNGQLISTYVKNISFQIYYNSSFSYTVTIQNPNVSLDYSLPVAFTTGVSVTQTNGLRVVGSAPYQVLVKTSTANLTNGSSVIPVSAVNLQVIPPPAKPAVVTTTRSLSLLDQVIISKSTNDHTYQTLDYGLRYYTSGNDSSISAAPPGIYSTEVYYIVLPL